MDNFSFEYRGVPTLKAWDIFFNTKKIVHTFIFFLENWVEKFLVLPWTKTTLKALDTDSEFGKAELADSKHFY